jgi:hypothetical protein
MFKQCLTGLMVVLIVAPVAESRKKKSKAGKVTDSTYYDANYGFQGTFPGNWKPKVHKAESMVRVTLVQQDFEPDEVFKRRFEKMSFMGEATSPLIEFWIIEAAAKPKDVLDSLLLDESKSDWRKPLMAAVEPTWSNATFQGAEGGPYQQAKVGSLKGMRWKGIFNYLHVDWGIEVDQGVALVCLSLDDETAMVVLMRSEPEYLDATMEVAAEMQKTLQFEATAEE